MALAESEVRRRCQHKGFDVIIAGEVAVLCRKTSVLANVH
jgi:hypothetical protein